MYGIKRATKFIRQAIDNDQEQALVLKFDIQGYFMPIRDLCINMNNHQKSTFHPLGDFLNPALVLLGQGLIKSPIWQKLNFANHPYLCKGLY
ncbi:hypothetical protein [uncultured Gammaproteobacteria bacterium]|nr:hypothetical protein [uncultured Gammaproteobacteria bacterium]